MALRNRLLHTHSVVAGKITLKWMLEKQGVKVWNQFK